jgi:cytochrome P450
VAEAGTRIDRRIVTSSSIEDDSGSDLSQVRDAVSSFFRLPPARREPARLFAWLTSEHRVLDIGGAWLVSGIEEVVAVCRNPTARTLSAVNGMTMPLSQSPSLANAFAAMLPTRDGQDHHRIKALLAPSFSSARIRSVRQKIEGCVDQIIADGESRGEMEVVADLAVPLPVALSCSILNIPEADWNIVRGWAEFVSSQVLRYDQTLEEILRVEVEFATFSAYINELCEDRRKHPGEDLISDLAVACHAGALSPYELNALVLMLLINGLETFTAGLTTAIWQALEQPAILRGVSGNRELAEAVFEECARLHTPVRFSARTLTGDLNLGGANLMEGDTVTLFYAAANRDFRRFPDPDRFDSGRVGRHVAFGSGPHYCLGAALSVTAGGVVMDRIARLGCRLTKQVETNELEWSDSLVYHTLKSLPVRLRADFE